mmetsp:Transcript_40917/g.73956  ORF Transcript_40917/g.73956 Transcript_40917/m.73956 type:complete len:271 (+) Transcript_40917:64-876(+)
MALIASHAVAGHVLPAPLADARLCQPPRRLFKDDTFQSWLLGRHTLQVVQCHQAHSSLRSPVRKFRLAMAVSRLTAKSNALALLELPPSAGRDDIRRRYRELVATEHPDKRPNDPLAVEKFQRIQDAYQELIKAPPVPQDSLDGVNIQEEMATARDEDFGVIFSDKVESSQAGPRSWSGKVSDAVAPPRDDDENQFSLASIFAFVFFGIMCGIIASTAVYINCDTKPESYCLELGIQPRSVREAQMRGAREEKPAKTSTLPPQQVSLREL